MARPRGSALDGAVRFAMPRAAKSALERIAAREGVPMAEVLRMGLKRALCDAMPGLAAFAKDTSNSPEHRMEAMQLIRDIHEAHLYMLPIGGPLARARAQDATDMSAQPRARVAAR